MIRLNPTQSGCFADQRRHGEGELSDLPKFIGTPPQDFPCLRFDETTPSTSSNLYRFDASQCWDLKQFVREMDTSIIKPLIQVGLCSIRSPTDRRRCIGVRITQGLRGKF